MDRLDQFPVSAAERPPEREPGAGKANLLKAILRSRWYPGIVQWPTLIVFAVIIYQLMLGPSAAHDNFGTALTWVLWWPIIPLFFLLLGRFWCAICPFGTVNDLVQKLVGSNQPLPKFLRRYGIWIIDAVFILITWGDHIWGIVESPRGSGVLLLMITVGVVASGALWERRTWCRSLCFLGGLSGNYSRSGMLELRATPQVCATCKVSACYKGNGKVPGCPMFEFPRTMDSSAECNLCGYCLKTCPNDSIRLTPRIPSKELWFIRKPKVEESFLAIVIMGIVFVQNITMLEIWKPILAALQNILGTDSYYATFSVTFLIAMAIPIILLLAAVSLSSRANRESVLTNFARFGYAIIPLDMAGHIAHNLFHLLAEGKAIGITFLGMIGIGGHGHESPALLGGATIQSLQYILLFLGTVGSLYTAYRIARTHHAETAKLWGSAAPLLVLVLLLAAANYILFSLPMGMRM